MKTLIYSLLINAIARLISALAELIVAIKR